MGTLISLPFLYIINPLTQLHRSINGHWYCYLKLLFHLWLKRRTSKGRFDLFDTKIDGDPRTIGLLPYKEEWDYECPNKSKDEDILMYGANSWGQYLVIKIKWRPKNGISTVHITYKHDNGHVYQIIEKDTIVVKGNKRIVEYKASGVSIEVMCPFKRLRLKIRGYMKCKDTNELIFVRMRLLWCPLSNVFDLCNDHDDSFIAKELSNSGTDRVLFDDRFEQFGQLKGTVQFESEPIKEVFLWGNRSKHYVNVNNHYECKKSTKIYGYDNKGFGFHVGFADFGNNVRYRYGNMFWGQGTVFPFTSIAISSDELITVGENPVKFTIENEIEKYNFNIEIEMSNVRISDNIRICDMKLNGHNGKVIIVDDDNDDNDDRNEQIECLNSNSVMFLDDVKFTLNSVLKICDKNAKNTLISGGKGSSLSILSQISNSVKNKFIVPNGVIVTTNAYEKLLKEYPNILQEIENVQSYAWSENRIDLKEKCEILVRVMSDHKIPLKLKNEINSLLSETFGNKLNSTLFAVRSSATGEDSEEMSAAGQMTTLLGVKGIDQICDAVMKCWASQFDYVAVEYKRGYGQLINSPMAVVIQEMVNCDSAGVMFTCDPFNGDERKIIITANYGLGESVVSAMADPDTVRLDVTIEGNSLIKPRNIKGIENVKIGTKKKCIKIKDENGGTEEIDAESNNNCCISDEDIVKLGEIALEVHRHYGNARDIEWGIKDGKIYLLQSRPVTNLDNSFTEWEIMHELDTGHPSENEYYSRANFGEVFPGASSHICLTWFIPVWNSHQFKGRNYFMVTTKRDYSPYYNQLAGVVCNQYFFALKTGQFPLTGDPTSTFSRSIQLGVFGHEYDDPQMFAESAEKSPKKSFSIFRKIYLVFYFIYFFLFPQKELKDTKEKMKNFDLLQNRKTDTAKDIYNIISVNSHQIGPANFAHGRCTVSSVMYNTIILNSLASEKDSVPENVYLDFGELLSSAKEVISVDVPKALRQIANAIPNRESFNLMSDSEAIEYLKNGDDLCCQIFREFLTVHGHRGYKEIDVHMTQWGENPLPLIKSLKSILNGKSPVTKPKERITINELLASLKTQIKGFKRLVLRWIIIPWALSGIGLREQSKSFFIWIVNVYRKAFWKMAELMVKEGRLPDSELLFHLTFQELETLVNERDPIIVARAKQRRRLFKKKDQLKFNETVIGPNMKPRNEIVADFNDTTIDGIVKIKGTPVSSGKIEARVCVAMNLEDAQNIQNGDILITYSTDIGWSPYFPMLSGLATEIGGLVSHGAVIAREYGLPCIISVEGAAKLFKTGDIVSFNSESGEIIKIS